MSARDTYIASVQSAEATKAATIYAAEQTRQLAADPVAGSAAKLRTIFKAEHDKQVAHAAARDTLRGTNDRDPF